MIKAKRFGILLIACCPFLFECGGKERAGTENSSGEATESPRSGVVTGREDASNGPGGRKERPAGLMPDGTDKYCYADPNGDGAIIFVARVPVENGQEIYVEYYAPFWEKRDPSVVVNNGGFDLLNAGRIHEPTAASVVRNQSFHEAIRPLFKLDYEGEFEGRVELLVYFNDGTGMVVSLGPSDRAFYRTGIVSMDAGVNLRAQPDVKAESLKVLGRGTKVYFTGKVSIIQPSDDTILDDFIVFEEVVVANTRGWAAVGTFGGEEYITIGEFELY